MENRVRKRWAARKTWATQSPNIRLKVFKQLEACGARNSEDLAELLANPRVGDEVRTSSAWALGIIGDKHALRALDLGLRTRNKGLVWECALALAKIPGPKAENVLLSTLKRRGNPESKVAAVAALGNVPSKKTVPSLVKILGDHKLSPRIRSEAADSLGKIGSKTVVKQLLDATYDKSAEVRFWAVYALGQTGSDKALDRLRELVRSDHAKLRHWGSISHEAKDAARQIMLAFRHKARGRTRSATTT